MNIFKNIFRFNSKWNKMHKEFWAVELKLKIDGYSKFQSDLASRVKSELTDLKIYFSTESSDHKALLNKSLTVKMITINLKSVASSKVWIYHDMAEYDLMNTHHIFEEWGYLKPEDLKRKFIESMKTELTKSSTT